MALLDLLKKAKSESSCTRCKKVIKGNEYKPIGKHHYCPECVSTEGKLLPEYLLLRTPSLLKEDEQNAKVLTCPLCKKEKPNPLFYSYDSIDNPYYFAWMGEQRFCYFCAVKQLPALNGLNSIQKGNTYFFYPVSDKDAEKSYWDDKVSDASWERQKSKLTEHPEMFEMVDRIIILEYYNPNNDSLMDDSTFLSVYANRERTLWYFRLENEFVSGWDGWPVWQGGFITPEQYLEYMERIGQKHHLFLFEKAKI